MTGRYVALGSSMAAGPGIAPRVPGSPRRAGRSGRNYPHLVAERLGHHLVDVTYSGATTGHVLADEQHGVAPQVDSLDGSERLITVTIGGNDVGYVPLLLSAALPRLVRRLPVLGGAIRDLLDPESRDRALADVAASLSAVGQEVRRRAPRATVLFVDYLTLLPPHDTPAPPLADVDVELGRHVGGTLARLTAEAAAATGCGLVRAGAASVAHHPWSSNPWVTRPGWPLPRRAAPLHPNAAGMHAVADLVIEEASDRCPTSSN